MSIHRENIVRWIALVTAGLLIAAAAYVHMHRQAPLSALDYTKASSISLSNGAVLQIDCPNCSPETQRVLVSDLRVLLESPPGMQAKRARNADVQGISLSGGRRWPKQLRGGADGNQSYRQLQAVRVTNESNSLAVDGAVADLYGEVSKWVSAHAGIERQLREFVDEANSRAEFCADSKRFFPPSDAETIAEFAQWCGRAEIQHAPSLSLYDGRTVSRALPEATTAIELFSTKSAESIPVIYHKGEWKFLAASP